VFLKLLVFLVAFAPGLLWAEGPTTHADGSVTWDPPAAYSGAYSGQLYIMQIPQHQIPEQCRILFRNHGLTWDKMSEDQKGCAAIAGNSCTIIIPTEAFQGASVESVAKHEIGHCNGWPSEHPD